MKFQRKAIEIAKMIKRLHKSKTPFVIAHSIYGTYDIGLDVFNYKSYSEGMGLYDVLKDFFFVEELGMDDTEAIALDLDDDVLEYLYEKADQEDKLVDEIIIEALRQTIEQIEANKDVYGDGI